jgi:ABC-type phosphate transport system substrate-binding protein
MFRKNANLTQALSVTTALAAVLAAMPSAQAQIPATLAGTEVPLTAAELSTYTANQLPTRGNPIQVPIAYGAIAVAYNQTGGPTGSINIATRDLCRIFDGTITNYNQLTTPSTTGFSGPITVEIRSDSSGTTNGFTSFLAVACPGAIGGAYFLSAGVNTFPTGTPALTAPGYTNFVRSSGNDGVTNAIGSTSGGLGYVTASVTSLVSLNTPNNLNPAPTAARLQVGGNTATFVLPNSAGVRAANTTALTLVPDATYPTTVFTIGGLVNSRTNAGGPIVPTAANAYPITVPTYFLAYTRYSTAGIADPDGAGPALAAAANPNAATAIKAFLGNGFLFANRTTPIGTNDQLTQQFGFSLPSNPFRAALRNAVNTIVQVP